MAKNIFIEGIQGSGKTTLLRKLSGMHPEYHVYYEGDISPVEMAWCSYMGKDDFARILTEYAYVKDEILKYTKQEGDILRHTPEFWQKNGNFTRGWKHLRFITEEFRLNGSVN